MTSRWLPVVGVIAVVFALRELRPVALPLAFALFLIGLLWPLQVRLQQRFRPRIAFALTLGVFALGLWGFGWVVAECVDEVVERWPKYRPAFDAMADRWAPQLQRLGLSQEGGGGGSGGVVKQLAVTAFDAGGAALLVIALTVLGLLEVQQFRGKLARGLPGEVDLRVVQSAQEASSRFGRYFATRTVLGAIQGVVTGVFCALVGLDLAVLWGVLSALLNYVPTIGSVVAVVPPALFALVQFPDAQKALLVAGGLAAIQVVLGNYVDPLLQGRWLSLSPFVVLLSITFWGFLWGPAGALIGVPLTIFIAIACEQVPSARWIAVLLSDARDGEAPGPPADGPRI